MRWSAALIIGVLLTVNDANVARGQNVSSASVAEPGVRSNRQSQPIASMGPQILLFDGPVLTTQNVVLKYDKVAEIDIPFRRGHYAVVAVRCEPSLPEGRLDNCDVKAAPAGQGYEEAARSLARNLVVGEELRLSERPIEFVYFEATLSNSDVEAREGPCPLSGCPSPPETVSDDEPVVEEPPVRDPPGYPASHHTPPPPGPLMDPQLNHKLEQWEALWNSAVERAASDFAATQRAIARLEDVPPGGAEWRSASEAMLRYDSARDRLHELVADLETLRLSVFGSGSRFDESRLSNEVERRRQFLDASDRNFIDLTVGMLRAAED